MHTDVLLKHHGIGELLLADWAGVLNTEWRFGPMDTKVCFQVPFCGERPPAYLALEGPLPGVDSVMHLQCTLAAQYAVADNTLIWVSHFLVNVFNQLLQF